MGPEGPNCNVEAMVAASKNRAMMSYRCSDPEVSDKLRYPTFTRMEPPDTQVTTSVLALLKYHKWFKFTIVSQKTEQWMTIAEDLRNQAEMREEFTVKHFVEFEDYDKCCLHVSSKIVWINESNPSMISRHPVKQNRKILEFKFLRLWIAAHCSGRTRSSRQRSKRRGSMSSLAIATCW